MAYMILRRTTDYMDQKRKSLQQIKQLHIPPGLLLELALMLTDQADQDSRFGRRIAIRISTS